MNPNYISKKVYSESSESEKEDDSESELLNIDKLYKYQKLSFKN